MSIKDVPIKKKLIKNLLIGMSWTERLLMLEPLTEHCRKMSRKEVYSKEVKKKIDEYTP